MPLEEILTQVNLRTDTPSYTPIKDLESDEFSVTNLREWLQNWGVPKLTATYSPNTQLPTAIPSTGPTVSVVTLQPTEHVETEQTITGKTTFQDILDWGVKPEMIEQIFGANLPPTNTVIRDYVTQQGIQFSSVITALQNEIDKVK